MRDLTPVEYEAGVAYAKQLAADRATAAARLDELLNVVMVGLQVTKG